jgi:hypothetical protein
MERAKKIAFWKPHFDAWRNTELSATAYCRQHGLSLHKFKYWQYQISKNNVSAQQDPETTKKNEPAFVEVMQASQTTCISSLSPSCEIVTQYGFTIHLHDGLSQQDFQHVLLALKALI